MTNTLRLLVLCICVGSSIGLADELTPNRILEGRDTGKLVSLTMANGNTYGVVVVESVDMESTELTWVKISYSYSTSPSSPRPNRRKSSIWIQVSQVCSIKLSERPGAEKSVPSAGARRSNSGVQGEADQSATAVDSKAEGDEKPKPESEGRSQ